ncbi:MULTISPECIES: hypothetical protein [unclassified Nitrobacter]|uniref:hypothetical protein n=1 Tax=unclassified Nitrobacter TaxID=2620411 RepID=UPI0009295C39|nr:MULTISPECIES: hypothetical protein [unclassified Nitrobacter]MBN9149774.1 hypothetical protein [Nitrobacter sp.]OJV03031.1 MAG: hypothetical protein BGO16_05150 [Nitrobacter sp. 62-23]
MNRLGTWVLLPLSGLIAFASTASAQNTTKSQSIAEGFAPHSLRLYQPNENCQNVKLNISLDDGTVRVGFENFTGGDKRKLAEFDQAAMVYTFGEPGCKIEVKVSPIQ